MRKHLTRDLVLFVVATAVFVYEVKFGGGRAPVLTACVSLLVSPMIMRADEARRNSKVDNDDA